ncbi:hypothetical protein ACFV2H_24990 [Streptomyces sp. NPDC059629]|uniref:hypothetical protein n=1 Tax=Streptomyces sp. NPDC059629 TaxID=3346889 RepID=UPI003676A7FC
MEFRIDRGSLAEAVAVAVQRLPARLSGAEEVGVAFNPAYLPDALNSFEGPELRLELPGSGQRALLSCGSSHQHLLMPVKQLVRAGLFRTSGVIVSGLR